MSALHDADVIIIGGGPVGLAAGIVCGEAGLRTIVCERKRYPLDKACGEGILPVGVASLKTLGVAPHIKTWREFRGIRYESPRGVAAQAEFAEGPGWGVRRTVLSLAFAARAREIATLTILEDATATPLAVSNDGVEVSAGGRTLRARLLIGADGRTSKVRAWAGLEATKGRTHRRWGMRQHFAVNPWSEFVEVYWGHGIEAYVTPVEANVVGVAFLWDRERGVAPAKGKDFFESLVARFPALKSRLHGAPQASTIAGVGPLEGRARSVVSDGVILIGDAAGYLDAITGEGISLGLRAALSLKTTLIPAMIETSSHTVVRALQLKPYSKIVERYLAEYYEVTGWALRMSRHAWLAEGIVAAMAQDARLFQHFLSANMGATRLHPMAARHYARLLWNCAFQ